MPTATVFEDKGEDEKEELKKKKKPEAKAPETRAPLPKAREFKAADLKGAEAIKTLMEIREIRETAKKGREIIARKKGEQIEPEEEEKDVKYKNVDIKSMLEPPPSKPPTPPKNPKDSEPAISRTARLAKLKPLDLSIQRTQTQSFDKITENIGAESEIVKKKKLKFEEMMRKMKKFLE